MKKYAIIKDNKVINVVLSENEDYVRSIYGEEILETSGAPWIDWFFEDNVWKSPKPHNSWYWVDNSWVAPIPYPEDEKEYVWDEDQKNWILVQ